MMIIGVDYHSSFQTIAFFVEETGFATSHRVLIMPHYTLCLKEVATASWVGQT